MVHGAFMLGFPSETEDEMQSTIDWAARSSCDTAAFFRVIPFKGAERFTQVEHAGFNPPIDWSAYEPYQTEINFSGVPESKHTQAAPGRVPALPRQPTAPVANHQPDPRQAHMLPLLTLLFARRTYAR